MRKWRVEDSAELYNINGWGRQYFSINAKGNVCVTPRAGLAPVDLREVLDELQVKDITAPLLLRFPDILDNRVEKISNCFKQAAEQYGYQGKSYKRGGKIVDSDRPCGVGEVQLYSVYGWCGVWQLCPSLSFGCHTDGAFRCRQSRVGENTGGEHRTLHRLRRLREPLPGAPLQRHLCGGKRTAQNNLIHEARDK